MKFKDEPDIQVHANAGIHDYLNKNNKSSIINNKYWFYSLIEVPV